MASSTGNGSQESPVKVDRRVPLRSVVFTSPVSVPGLNSFVTSVVVGERRLMGGVDTPCPRPFLDPVARTIWIEGREYPLERVVSFERDKTGFMPKMAPLPDHTIGKKAKSE